MKKLITCALLILLSTPAWSQDFFKPFQSSAQTTSQFLAMNSKGHSFLWTGQMDPDSFWKNLENTAVVSGTTKDATGAIYSDLIVDRMGLFRIAFASSLIASDNDTVRDLQSILAGGGNAIIKGAYPLFVWWGGTNPQDRSLSAFLAPRAGANLPVLGSSSTSLTWNIDMGLEVHGLITSQKRLISFLGKFRVAWLVGSKDFTSKLVKDRNNFGYGLGSVGILLKETVFINVNLPVNPFFEEELNKLPASISLGVSF